MLHSTIRMITETILKPHGLACVMLAATTILRECIGSAQQSPFSISWLIRNESLVFVNLPEAVTSWIQTQRKKCLVNFCSISIHRLCIHEFFTSRLILEIILQLLKLWGVDLEFDANATMILQWMEVVKPNCSARCVNASAERSWPGAVTFCTVTRLPDAQSKQ